MKKILAILFCLTIHKISNAQVNYVVNGGFEQMDCTYNKKWLKN